MKTSLYILAVSSSFLCCKKESKHHAPSFCDAQTIVSNDVFKKAPSDPLVINSLAINHHCLTVNFSAGGCNGDSWEVKLIDSEFVMESMPEQRKLLLSLKNEEMCEAYLTKELSFNISNLQTSGNSVVLRFENSDQSIVYEYD